MHQSVSVNTQVNRKKCCYLKIIFLKRCWYSLHAYVQCMMFCILHFVPYFHSLFHYQAISLFDDCIKLLSIEHIRFRANVQNSSNFTVKVFENAPNNFNIMFTAKHLKTNQREEKLLVWKPWRCHCSTLKSFR